MQLEIKGALAFDNQYVQTNMWGTANAFTYPSL